MEAGSSEAASGSSWGQDSPQDEPFRIAAIYGANASGKTTLFKALAYMKNAVRNSQKLWPPDGPPPREPFLLDSESKNDPSFFEADFLLDQTRFRYAFTLDDREILEERLDAYPQGKRQTWLRREGRDFIFGKDLAGDNQAIKRRTRPNSLFLSAAAEGNHPALLPLYGWFAKQVIFVPRDRRAFRRVTAEMCRSEALKPSILRLLGVADPLITGLSVREEDLYAALSEQQDPQNKQLLGDLIGSLQKLIAAAKEEEPDAASSWEKRPVLTLLHKGSGDTDIPLEEEQESDGALAFLGLFGPVLQAVRSGGTVCVDGIETGLHPLLALRIVRLFSNAKVAARGAQIIFITHDTNLLNVASLRREQIWFTEKDAEGGTHLYPLTDFVPKANEKLGHGYLQGHYGAVPFIGWKNFFAQLDARAGR